jgi:hypothetical protein
LRSKDKNIISNIKKFDIRRISKVISGQDICPTLVKTYLSQSMFFTAKKKDFENT